MVYCHLKAPGIESFIYHYIKKDIKTTGITYMFYILLFIIKVIFMPLDELKKEFAVKFLMNLKELKICFVKNEIIFKSTTIGYTRLKVFKFA